MGLFILSNKNHANVFYRLGIVELFGTRITQIKKPSAEGIKQPDFELQENAI